MEGYKDAIADLLWRLECLVYDAGDFITLEDGNVEQLFFLTSGTADMYFEGEKKVRSYQAGAVGADPVASSRVPLFLLSSWSRV